MIKLWFQFVVLAILLCTVSTDSAWALTDFTPNDPDSEAAAFSDQPAKSQASAGSAAASSAQGGVGILLSLDKPHFVVQYVLPGMPAASANVQVGDLLIAVDDVPVDKAKKVEEVVDKIRGVTGTTVKLTIQSGGKIREVSLVRGTIPTIKPDATDVDFGREVSIYFYQHEDLIPEEPGRYGFMGDHSVAEFFRKQLLRHDGH